MNNANIEELAKCKQREYLKAWRAANKEKTKKHREDYWKNRVLRELQEQEKTGGVE